MVPQVVEIAGAMPSPRKILSTFQPHKLAVGLWHRTGWRWWEVNSTRARSWEHLGGKLRSGNLTSSVAWVQRDTNLSPPRGRIILAAWVLPSCTWGLCGELCTPGCLESHLHRHPRSLSRLQPCPHPLCTGMGPWASVYISPGLAGDVLSRFPVPNTSCKLGRARLPRALEQNVGGAFKASASGSFHSTAPASHVLLY